MPVLKQITCTLEKEPSGLPIKEYATAYGDGLVDTYVAVPDEPTTFCIHLQSSGYIAPSLAMFVYIDGVYQCNRYRRSLMGPTDATTPNHCQVDFRVRQKEERVAKGRFLGRSWRFESLNVASVDTVPNVDDDVVLGNIGTIEVVVRRIQGPAPGPSSTPAVSHSAAKPAAGGRAKPTPTTKGKKAKGQQPQQKKALSISQLDGAGDGADEPRYLGFEFGLDGLGFSRSSNPAHENIHRPHHSPRGFGPTFADYMLWRATHPAANRYLHSMRTQRANTYYEQYRPDAWPDSGDMYQPNQHRQRHRQRSSVYDGVALNNPRGYSVFEASDSHPNGLDATTDHASPYTSRVKRPASLAVTSSDSLSNIESELTRRPRSKGTFQSTHAESVVDSSVGSGKRKDLLSLSSPAIRLPSYRRHQQDGSLASFSSRPDPMYNPRYPPEAPATTLNHSKCGSNGGHDDNSKMPGGWTGLDPYESVNVPNPFATPFINSKQRSPSHPRSPLEQFPKFDNSGWEAAKDKSLNGAGEGGVWSPPGVDVSCEQGNSGGANVVNDATNACGDNTWGGGNDETQDGRWNDHAATSLTGGGGGALDWVEPGDWTSTGHNTATNSGWDKDNSKPCDDASNTGWDEDNAKLNDTGSSNPKATAGCNPIDESGWNNDVSADADKTADWSGGAININGEQCDEGNAGQDKPGTDAANDWANTANDPAQEAANECSRDVAPTASQPAGDRASNSCKGSRRSSSMHPSSGTFIRKARIHEQEYVKSYWQSWNAAPARPPAVPQPQPKHDADDVTEVFAASEAPYVVPEATARARHVDQYVHAGKGYDYMHATGHPVYMDSLEQPYAVFRFHYRSRDMLRRVLGRGGREALARNDATEKEEESRRSLLQLSKEDLVQQLMEAGRKKKRNKKKGSKRSKPGSERKASTVHSQPQLVNEWVEDVAAAATPGASASDNPMTTCNRCNGIIATEWWHCSTCDDYDLCCACVDDRSMRCMDASHDLHKWKEGFRFNASVTGPQATGEVKRGLRGGSRSKQDGSKSNGHAAQAGGADKNNTDAANDGWGAVDGFADGVQPNGSW